MKNNGIEEYFEKNNIEIKIDDGVPFSKNSEIVVFTTTTNTNKSLGEEEIEKIKRIFGRKIVVNPADFYTNPVGKFVIGPECWQIYYAASKKIPTFLITNKGNYSKMFLKMFPRQKKIDL